MKRLCSVLGLVLFAMMALVGVPSTAHADDDPPSSWRITKYDVRANVAANGTADVTLDLDFDFANDAGHGPYLWFPLRQRVAGNPDIWRMTDVEVGEVTSPSGANADVKVDTDDGNLKIRVGRQGTKWEGVQSYRIRYSIRGLIAPNQASSGLDEVNWNVVGPAWDVPITNMSATVTGPADISRVACFQGDRYDVPCAASETGNSAVFSATGLDKREPVQIVAGFPAGTFVGAEPRFEKRFHVGNMFPLTPLSGGLAALATALGLGAVVATARRASRDEVYLGVTPGLNPGRGDGGNVGRASGTAPVTVQFTPPRGTTPGELGVLQDYTADNADVTGTILDLAVRGHLVISEAGEKEWSFQRRSSSERLHPYETHVLDTLFQHGDQVTTEELRDADYGELMSGTRTKLYERTTKELNWFRVDPARSRAMAVAVGIAVIVVGGGLSLVLALTLGLGLVVIAPLVIGLAILAMNNKFGSRTADGSAILAQSKGFELYLSTAEADQIRFEEGIDVFSRYLPYAVVYGVADRWAKLFEKLAAEGRYTPDTGWYVGSYYYGGMAASVSDLGHSIESAISASTEAAQAATSGSSGGSGFSGGGGFGGGGGGGW